MIRKKKELEIPVAKINTYEVTTPLFIDKNNIVLIQADGVECDREQLLFYINGELISGVTHWLSFRKIN